MTHNTREVEEDWKAELRREYRKQTLAMAREVSASGTYEKVEGMICDWWFDKIDHQLQKAREEERERIEKDLDRRLEIQKKVSHSEYEGGYTHALQDVKEAIHSELDQDVEK